MKWPWSRKPRVSTEEAQRALAEAERERAKVEAQQTRVDYLAQQLFQYGNDNHFSELILESMRRRGKT